MTDLYAVDPQQCTMELPAMPFRRTREEEVVVGKAVTQYRKRLEIHGVGVRSIMYSQRI
jgi:hypothetical protein